MESSQNEKVNSPNDLPSHRIVKIGYVMIALVGAALFFSLVIAFTAGYKQIANRYDSISPSPGLVLDVIYPRYLLLDTPSSAFMMTLTAADSANFTQPLTVTLALPPSIVMSGTASNEWVFEGENGRYQQATFFLQNTGILTGIVPSSPKQSLTVSNSLASDPTALSIRVETSAAAAVRQFMLGLLQDKSPLLLALAALLPIAALLLQQWQKQEDRETAVREQQLAQQTEKLLEQVIQLRHYLTEANRAGVQYTWQQINQSLLEATLSFHEYQWLKSLVNLCLTGELDQEKKSHDMD